MIPAPKTKRPVPPETEGQAARRYGLLVVAVALVATLSTAAIEDKHGELTKAEARGKLLYTAGTSSEGRKIIAVLGEGGTEIPASALPCVGCHGRRGEGNAEGGLTPSNLQWEILVRPYSGRATGGRQHPAYTEALFKRAVAMGIDSGGQPLHAAMPLYRLTHQENADLIAYLQKISSERDPGVTTRTLRLGVILPPPGVLDSMSSAIRAVIEARFAQLNKAGGIYGRSLEPRFLSPPEEGWRRRAEVARFVEEEEIFALLASYMAGAEAELAAFASAEGVPSVGPFSLHPRVETPVNPFVFYLLSGLEQQARALVQFAGDRWLATGGRLLILHANIDSLATVVAACQEQAAIHPATTWSSVEVRSVAHNEVLDLASLATHPTSQGDDASNDQLLFLGSEEQTASLLATIARSDWRPRILLLGPLAGGALAEPPTALVDLLFVAQPTLPSDRSRRARELYRSLRLETASTPANLAVEFAALAATETLIEALMRGGRAISRQKLVQALEGFHDLQTGLTPPLTFNPNRRIGALGAYIVTPETTTDAGPRQGPWVALR